MRDVHVTHSGRIDLICTGPAENLTPEQVKANFSLSASAFSLSCILCVALCISTSILESNLAIKLRELSM